MQIGSGVATEKRSVASCQMGPRRDPRSHHRYPRDLRGYLRELKSISPPKLAILAMSELARCSAWKSPTVRGMDGCGGIAKLFARCGCWRGKLLNREFDPPPIGCELGSAAVFMPWWPWWPWWPCRLWEPMPVRLGACWPSPACPRLPWSCWGFSPWLCRVGSP